MLSKLHHGLQIWIQSFPQFPQQYFMKGFENPPVVHSLFDFYLLWTPTLHQEEPLWHITAVSLLALRKDPYPSFVLSVDKQVSSLPAKKGRSFREKYIWALKVQYVIHSVLKAVTDSSTGNACTCHGPSRRKIRPEDLFVMHWNHENWINVFCSTAQSMYFR